MSSYFPCVVQKDSISSGINHGGVRAVCLAWTFRCPYMPFTGLLTNDRALCFHANVLPYELPPTPCHITLCPVYSHPVICLALVQHPGPYLTPPYGH